MPTLPTCALATQPPDSESFNEVVRSALTAWISKTWIHCACDPATCPAGRCNRHVEFLWRRRFKDDLVSQFVRSEPWLSKCDRLNMRDMMVSCLKENGFECLLANTSAAKARVAFPDGSVHRVTGIATGIRRKHADGPILAVIKPALPSPLALTQPPPLVVPSLVVPKVSQPSSHASTVSAGGSPSEGGADLSDSSDVARLDDTTDCEPQCEPCEEDPEVGQAPALQCAADELRADEKKTYKPLASAGELPSAPGLDESLDAETAAVREAMRAAIDGDTEGLEGALLAAVRR